VTSFFGIKGAFFLKTTRRISAKFFFRVYEKTLVHYNLHWKAMHPAFKVFKLSSHPEKDAKNKMPACLQNERSWALRPSNSLS